MLRKLLQIIRFLARQGLALRGHIDGADSNFTQLLRLRAFDCPALLTWMEKKNPLQVIFKMSTGRSWH